MPLLVGDRIGCEVELGIGCEVRTAVLWDDSPSATAQGLTRRTASTLAKSESRPLRGPRVNGNVFFSTTHFSGADEARLLLGLRGLRS